MTDDRSLEDELNIRLRTPRDDSDLLALFNQERFLRYASARGSFAAVKDLRAWLANIACSRRVEIVGEVAGRAIAFGGLYVLGDGLAHSGWILIGVDEALQGRGYGARLLKMLMASASVAIGLRRIQLTVFADNEPAIRLYSRFGFEIEGRHRDQVRRGDGFIDVLAMAKIYPDREDLAPEIAAAQPGGSPRPVGAQPAAFAP